MVIYFGADHRGYGLKQKLFAYLKGKGYQVVDRGPFELVDGDDYVDFAKLVGEDVSRDPETRGILVCGSGGGMVISANKFPRVRAAIGYLTDQVYDMRHDEDLNVLCLAADYVDEDMANKIADVFLSTPFSPEERFVRRLEKIEDLEHA